MSHVTQLTSLSGYNRWADDQIAAATESLSDDALQTEAADGRSIVETLAHSVQAQLWWLGNWTGVPSPLYEYKTRSGLQRAFADSHSRIDALVAATDDLEWERRIQFSFPGASVVQLPAWQTFVQVTASSTAPRSRRRSLALVTHPATWSTFSGR